MSNLDNSPWAAFSSLRTLSNYDEKEMQDFAVRLIGDNDPINIFFDLVELEKVLVLLKKAVFEEFSKTVKP